MSHLEDIQESFKYTLHKESVELDKTPTANFAIWPKFAKTSSATLMDTSNNDFNSGIAMLKYQVTKLISI